MKYYMLKNKQVVEAPMKEAMKWSMNFKNKQVASTHVGDVHISTVFLSIDHRLGEGMPILFETMIFDGEHDGYCKRYSTWEQAEQGHKETVKMVKVKHLENIGKEETNE